jgi:Na+/proline symporter
MAFLPANLLFLALGVLLVMWYRQQRMTLPAGDELLPNYIAEASAQAKTAAGSSWLALQASFLEIVFVLGIVAASFSSADSALTSLTTIFCVDILKQSENEQARKRVHLMMCLLFVVFILVFKAVNSTSLIDAVYTIVSYTYGPLLGLFAFGLLTRRSASDRWTPYIAVAAPLLCFAIDYGVGRWLDYRFGYELLMLNGMLTFAGLWLTGGRRL